MTKKRSKKSSKNTKNKSRRSVTSVVKSRARNSVDQKDHLFLSDSLNTCMTEIAIPNSLKKSMVEKLTSSPPTLKLSLRCERSQWMTNSLALYLSIDTLSLLLKLLTSSPMLTVGCGVDITLWEQRLEGSPVTLVRLVPARISKR